jgi:hypothetical protein
VPTSAPTRTTMLASLTNGADVHAVAPRSTAHQGRATPSPSGTARR